MTTKTRRTSKVYLLISWLEHDGYVGAGFFTPQQAVRKSRAINEDHYSDCQEFHGLFHIPLGTAIPDPSDFGDLAPRSNAVARAKAWLNDAKTAKNRKSSTK